MIFTYFSILLLIIGDQIVKIWTVSAMPLHSQIIVLPNIFSLFHIRNTGAAWGILSGEMTLFYIMTIIIIGSLMYWYHTKKTTTFEKIAFVLIVSGAIGNFIDRLRLGYVIDMFRFDFIDFPIFNVADICLTLGIVVFLIETIRSEWFGKEK